MDVERGSSAWIMNNRDRKEQGRTDILACPLSELVLQLVGTRNTHCRLNLRDVADGSGYSKTVFVAERRLSLAQPLKAGITYRPQLFVASATVDCSIVADATQIQKTFSIPALGGRAKFMPTLRVENPLLVPSMARLLKKCRLWFLYDPGFLIDFLRLVDFFLSC